MEPKKIVIVIPMTQIQKNRLEQIFPRAEFLYTSIPEVTREQVRQAEIILGNVPHDMIPPYPADWQQRRLRQSRCGAHVRHAPVAAEKTAPVQG